MPCSTKRRSGASQRSFRWTILPSGIFKGQTATAINLLQGSLEQDKLFAAGDRAQVVISLVYGFDKQCSSAVSGSFLGILITLVLAMIVTDLFKIHGAVMDLSVDITSAVHEEVERKPDVKPWEAVKSGMNVGCAAMGTMTTTLLLAYSGGYIAMLMVFMAQGTPVEHIFNDKYVSAEIFIPSLVPLAL